MNKFTVELYKFVMVTGEKFQIGNDLSLNPQKQRHKILESEF